jgi:hypothetical protein
MHERQMRRAQGFSRDLVDPLAWRDWWVRQALKLRRERRGPLAQRVPLELQGPWGQKVQRVRKALH